MQALSDRKVAPRSGQKTTARAWILFWVILLLAACSASPEGETIPSPTPGPTAEPTATLSPPPAPTTLPTPTLEGVEEAPSSPEAALATETPAPAEPEPTAPPPQAVEHRVRAGEALLGLAMDYGVPMAAIQLENGLGEVTTVWVDQVLLIPPATEWPDASPYWMLHEIQAGETLSSIAASNDLQLESLKSANGLSDTDLLAIGQLLILPFEGPEAILAAAPPPNLGSAAPAAGEGGRSDSGESASPAPPPVEVIPLPADIAGWPAYLFQLINQARANHGLPPLAYNQTLAWAAQQHAGDCSQRGWCSHTGSDGASSEARILRAGYPAAGTGECWVYAGTPQEAFEFWFYEVPPNDAHRRMLLSSFVSEVGIGIVPADWGYYFVADFGRPAQ